MGKVRLVIVIVALVLLIAVGAITFGLIPGVTWNSFMSSSSTPAGTSGDFVNPTVQETTVQTVGPTVQPTVQGTITPTPSSTVEPLVSSSSDPLVGSWYGSKSLFFGMASADFTLTALEDGTMTIAGVINAPIAEIENKEFSIDATWQHQSGTTYLGTIDEKLMEFTCDGSQISLTINPYATGLIDNEMLNMDIDLTLTRS